MYYSKSDKVIIIDYSQTIISNLMAEIGSRNDVPIEVDLLRHMVVNNVRSYNVKFKREYGEIVIACDSKKYWRKNYFPYYKANRKKAREDSGFNWALIFETINQIKEEFKQYFPYRVVEVEGAEADDVIATLCEYSQQDIKEGTLQAKPVLIISGDHDFIQLQKYKNVSQFSPVQKKFVKPETTPEKYVIEHIIKGDKGDGVPNVLTSDDAIVSGERQKPVNSKKLEGWINNPSTMPKDETFVRNYQRNKVLVDFSEIPEQLKTDIINNFSSQPIKDKSKLLDYFIANRMKMMIEHIEEL